MSEFIEIKQKDSIAILNLNRPEAYNALHDGIILDLVENLTQITKDDTVKGVIITGKGKAFSGGGDLKYAHQFKGGPGRAFYKMAAQFHLAVLEIRRMPKPVIAAINGMAAGGGFSLALACDFRVMEKSAILKQAYTSNGLCIDGGGTYSLPRLVGLAKALEITGLDPNISAEQALQWGLITRIAEDGKVVEGALKLIDDMNHVSPNSFAWTKRLLTDSLNRPMEAHLEREREGLVACSEHPEGQEGIQAFLEKRKARFV